MVNMITTPSNNKIKIIQDIQLRKPQNADGDPFRKKRRLTGSMLLLQEEPVFSDSDEEREFSKRIFGSIQPVKNKCDILTGQNTTIPVKDKCDAEVQCDLLTPEKALYGLINRCSKLNADDVGDFKDVIKSCEKFIVRHSFNINEADALSDISYVSNDARYSSSSRKKKKEKEKVKPNNTLNGGLVSSDECRKKSDNRKESKRISVKSRRNDLYSSFKKSFEVDVVPVKSGRKSFNSTFKKPFEVDVVPVKSGRNCFNSTFKKPFEVDVVPVKSGRNGFDSTFKKPFEVDVGNVLETSCSPNILNVKSLARNWMKPNKSFCTVEKDLGLKPHFTSLQSTKSRRQLYSPTSWTLSQDFLNIATDK